MKKPAIALAFLATLASASAAKEKYGSLKLTKLFGKTMTFWLTSLQYIRLEECRQAGG